MRMLRKYFYATPAYLPVAPGRTIYAVGDMHGRSDLTPRILRNILEDIAKTDPYDPVLVFLGDYIDRGDDSAGVLEILIRLNDSPFIETHFLKGNHEEAMLDFLASPEDGAAWLRFGGLQTLMSYGVKGAAPDAPPHVLHRIAKELREAMGSDLDFLKSCLKLNLNFGNIFLCHAAIDAQKPLDQQRKSVLVWGHRDFLKQGGGDKAWVIHGHTISEEPDVGFNRIGIDTGAYYSGALSAVKIYDGGYEFLSTK